MKNFIIKILNYVFIPVKICVLLWGILYMNKSVVDAVLIVEYLAYFIAIGLFALLYLGVRTVPFNILFKTKRDKEVLIKGLEIGHNTVLLLFSLGLFAYWGYALHTIMLGLLFTIGLGLRVETKRLMRLL